MRDISLELAILRILDRLAPTPLNVRTLAAEASIATDRELTTIDYTDAIKSLEDRSMIRRGKSVLGIEQVWITEAGRAALRQ